MPQKKKDPSTRARRNRASTAAKLPREKAPADSGDYASMTVVALKGEVDIRNGDGRSEGRMLSKRGTKAALIAALVADDDPTPTLPPFRTWHLMTQMFWDDIWASPMSNEWHESDIHNLYAAAMHSDDMWNATTAAERQKADTALCKRLEPLGLTPYARRRLEWSIESAEEAKDRGKQRRTAGRSMPPAQQPTGTNDPRALHAVS